MAMGLFEQLTARELSLYTKAVCVNDGESQKVTAHMQAFVIVLLLWITTPPSAMAHQSGCELIMTKELDESKATRVEIDDETAILYYFDTNHDGLNDTVVTYRLLPRFLWRDQLVPTRLAYPIQYEIDTDFDGTIDHIIKTQDNPSNDCHSYKSWRRDGSRWVLESSK